MSARYTGVAVSTGDGRAAGHARTDDGLLDLDLVLPPEMGGPGGATNPEQLFAAGWASCFHSALKTVAARTGRLIVDSVVVAAVQLHSTADGRLTLSAALHVDVSGVGQVAAEELALAAHATCPYSVATRGNVPVSVTVRVGERLQ
ncbi:Ohr family peroxiredoxin [Amycolatopsis jiangsuensis]|uniref:Ohr subfamily peroxiredoxin n=1 Tax=Amycolatopsis jiangsuensis TaxID=1181879 RepID=A0A840ITA0_9PSEU|nr:Ohr family peroxiredoxin [Amycolatopsis jiangsuensis]MBB4684378.1 Ohr subfamily peroxiredoxin [Amycolatopsis jiangsuensis]